MDTGVWSGPSRPRPYSNSRKLPVRKSVSKKVEKKLHAPKFIGNSSASQVFYDLVRSTVVVLSTLLIPLSIGVAILHYHLWDMNLIIKRSLVIGPLATILTVVFELASQLLLPFIFQFVPALDDSPSINTVVSVVIVVALFKPLHARLEAGVNRLVDRLFGGGRTSESLRREEDTFISPPAEQKGRKIPLTGSTGPSPAKAGGRWSGSRKPASAELQR